MWKTPMIAMMRAATLLTPQCSQGSAHSLTAAVPLKPACVVQIAPVGAMKNTSKPTPR